MAARECTDVRPGASGSGSGGSHPIRDPVKLLAMITAAAALALSPAAAASPNPGKADKPAKAERTKKAKPDSARARCAAEKKSLGVAAFTAKYGKARTKGSAKAKAKAARAAMGRCVSKTAKVIRAERQAAEEEEEDELEEHEEEEVEGDLFVDDAPEEAEKPEPDDGGVFVDHEDDPKSKGHEDDDHGGVGLGGAPDLD